MAVSVSFFLSLRTTESAGTMKSLGRYFLFNAVTPCFNTLLSAILTGLLNILRDATKRTFSWSSS